MSIRHTFAYPRAHRALGTVGAILAVSAVHVRADAAPMRVATGTYTGNGQSTRLIASVGFAPDVVIVQGEGGTAAVVRSATMGPNRAKTLGPSDPLLSDAIKSLDANGFTVGPDARVNAASTVYYWVAFAAAPGELAAGFYTGDGIDGRVITEVGFRPGHLIVMAEENERAMHRYADQAVDESFEFHAGGTKSDRIQDFTSDGFELGKDPTVNKDGFLYHFIAWAPVTARAVDGSYLGDGTDDRDVAIAGFVPDVVIVRHHDGNAAVFRPAALPSGAALVFEDGLRTDTIQALVPGGFQVGTDDFVNKSADVYYWSALRDAFQCDLGVDKTVDDATPAEGQTIEFTLVVTSSGPDDATGVWLKDVLPEGLTYSHQVATQGDYDPATGRWDVGTLVAGSATLVLGATVDAGTGGTTILNAAAVGATNSVDPVPENDEDTAEIEVQRSCDLVVSKDVDDPSPDELQQIVYTLRVRNEGPSDATGVELLDLLPDGVTYVGDTPSQGVYFAGDGHWIVGTLPDGGVATLDLRGVLAAGTAGSTIQNAAAVAALDQRDPDQTNDADSVRVEVHGADLSLVKSIDDATPDEGQLVTYSILLTNAGPDTATAVAVTDLLPAGISHVSHTPSQGSYADTTGVWSVGTLAVSGSATLTLVGEVAAGTAGTTITNAAAVTASVPGDPSPAGDDAELTVRSADISLLKSVNDGMPNEGDTITYTLTLENLGPDDAAAIAVSDLLPAGVTFVSATPDQGSYTSGTGVWDVGDLAASAATTLTITASVDPATGGQTIANVGEVTAVTPVDPESENDIANADITVQSADLAVAKSVDDARPNEGQAIVYTITVANDGPSDATGVEVTDALPAGVTYQTDGASQGTYDEPSGVWSVGTIPAGSSATLVLGAVVSTGTSGATITNVATVTGVDQADPAPGDETDGADITVQSADLSITKTANIPAPEEGATLTYTIRLTNTGPDPASGVAATDVLPAGVTYQTHIVSEGSYDSESGVWSLGSVGAGATETLTLVTTVDAGTAGSTITNVAEVSAVDQVDPAPGDEIDSVDVDPVPAGSGDSADLSLEKLVDDATPDVGQLVTFMITLTNDGPDPATGVEVVDLLPDGVTYDEHSVSQGTYAHGTGVWSAGSIAAGDGATLSVAATVDEGTAATTITNSAAVTAVVQGDPVPGNESDSAAITVKGADLVAGIAVDDGSPGEGQTITLTVDLSNQGPDAATGVTVASSMPPGLTFVGDAASQGTYSSGTGEWSVGTLAASTSATLELTATVDTGTAGGTLEPSAAVIRVDQEDPAPGDESMSVEIVVQGANLVVTKTVDDASPNEGDTVVFSVTVGNEGPHTASGLAITDVLPPGLLYSSDTPTQGSYTIGSGEWTVGSLAASSSATLELAATVDSGTGGEAIVNVASVGTVDQADPSPGDESGTATVTVQSADLVLTNVVDDGTPAEGDVVTFELALANEGPDEATEIIVADPLPAGLIYESDTATQGSYAGGTGSWSVGTLAPGETATLELMARVDAGTAGTTITNTALVDRVAQADPSPGNETASAALTVTSADLALVMRVDEPTTTEGASLTYTLSVQNLGPDHATGVSITDLLPVDLSYVADAPGQGIYLPGSGLWAVGSVAPGDSATLVLTAAVDAGTAGTTIRNTASISNSDLADPVPANDMASVDVEVTTRVTLHADAQPFGSLRPGGPLEDVLVLELTNESASSDTLTTLTIQNAAEGAGAVAELDEEWRALELWLEGETGARAVASFSAGRATFADLELALGPGEGLRLVIRSAASLAARDGDVLDVVVASPDDVGMSGSTAVVATWPVDPPGGFDVDGMSAAQIDRRGGTGGTLLSGSAHNVAFAIGIPANGYEADVLNQLTVVNEGNASSGTDITRLEAWIDADEDAALDLGIDTWLGELADTGDRWVLSGLSQPVPLAGVGLLVTCDVSVAATEGRTLRLALPQSPDYGLGMASANDGPIDAVVRSAGTQTITTANRVTIGPVTIEPEVVPPNATDVLLLHFTAENSYAGPKTLTTLRVANAGDGAGTVAERDAGIARLLLRVDGDGNGLPGTLDEDPIVGTSFFTDGTAVFTGIGSQIGSGETLRLFVTADLDAARAADGDVIDVRIEDATAVTFSDDTAVAGSWPLDSDAEATIDGMIREQLSIGALPAATIGPLEGPVPALELVIPRNGYADDVLTGLTLGNVGTATPADLGDVRLWRDGGDEVFDAGASDDVDLGALFFGGGSWVAPTVSEPLPAGGARLFVAVMAAGAPSDSATVRFELPPGGVVVASGNDGPIDGGIESTNTVLLSTGVLLAAFDLDPAVSTIGGLVDGALTVRNTGPEPVTGITPSPVVTSGDGALAIVSGPDPAAMSLAPGESGVFTWSFRADSAGTVRVRASAEGTEAGSGLERRSLTVESDDHAIFEEAHVLDVFPVESMPFSVSRGQENVVPLSLTFSNPNSAGSSDIRVLGLTVRVETETGQAIVPRDLFSRLIVTEGSEQYLNQTELGTMPGTMELRFAQAAVIESGSSGGQATLSLSFDIAESTLVSDFRIVIEQSTWIQAVDANSGAPVTSNLQGGTYPVSSGLARIVGGSEGLWISRGAYEDRTVTRGQNDVTALRLGLVNEDPAGTAGDVRVSAFDVSLVDSLDMPIASPHELVESIRAATPFQTLLDRIVTPVDGTTITLSLITPLSVPVGTTLPLEILVDVADDAPLVPVRVHLGDAGAVDARDAISGEDVPVYYTEDPMAGGVWTVQSPAMGAVVAGTGRLPGTVTIGDTGVEAVELQLTHPGTPGTAAIRCESLTFQVRDERNAVLVPGEILERAEIAVASGPVGTLDVLPDTGGTFTVPLSGVSIDAGQTLTLTLAFDVRVTAPTTYLNVLLPESGLGVVDANLGTPVDVSAPAGEGFPVSSNLTRLQLPPRELRVSMTSRMPAVLVADGSSIAIATLSLRAPASPPTAPIHVDALELDAATGELAGISAGDVLRSIDAFVGDTLWASSGELQPGVASAVLSAGAPIQVEPGVAVSVEIRAVLRDGFQAGSLRIGCDSDGIRVVQPENAVYSIGVEPEAGEAFPFWTDVGNSSGASLAGSWSNFPNPFAAGRQSTRFVFFLPQPGDVSLRIYTPRGDRIRTIIANDRIEAGLHQGYEWDGRNGKGRVVRSGVFVAEIQVAFADGSSERRRRKIAVIR